MHEAPHAPRRGRLKNGNQPGDLSQALRCCARTRSGATCRSPAMRNGKCRMHGGASTGARTPEGQLRARTAPLKHGLRSAAAVAQRRALTAELRALQVGMAQVLQDAAAYLRALDDPTAG